MSWEKRVVDEIIAIENLKMSGYEETTGQADTCPDCGSQLMVRWFENDYSEEVSDYACPHCGWSEHG